MPRKVNTSDLLVDGMTIDDLLALHRSRFGDMRMEDPQRPDDVTQEEWDALGDPGRRALDRVRRNQREAERARDAAVQERDSVKTERDTVKGELDTLKKNPPKQDPPKDPPDVAAQIQAAVDSALQNVTKTYTEQLDQLRAERTAEQITAHAQRIAADVLVDPSLVGTFVDLRTVVNQQGQVDEQALRDNLAGVVEQRPYLAKPDQPATPYGSSPYGTHPGGARPAPDKATFDARVAEQLQLARSSGLAVKSDVAKAAAASS